VAGFCEESNGLPYSIKLWRISWAAERLSDSQGWRCSMETVLLCLSVLKW